MFAKYKKIDRSYHKSISVNTHVSTNYMKFRIDEQFIIYLGFLSLQNKVSISFTP